MTHEEQREHFEEFIRQMSMVLFSKSEDYATTTDKLSNFKNAGKICGLTPELNCLSLIATKVARLGILLNFEERAGKPPNNESIHDSIVDLANYACLLSMIMSEDTFIAAHTPLYKTTSGGEEIPIRQ